MNSSTGGDLLCPTFAPFFGFAGASSAIMFTTLGAAYGTAKAGVGIAGMGQFKPQLIMKSLIPVIMASIIAIYGLVVSVLITGTISHNRPYSLYTYGIFFIIIATNAFNCICENRGAMQLAAGLATGGAGMAAGICIGNVGDAAVRAYAQQNRVFVGMVLVLIFAEVLALYGLILSLILNSKSQSFNIC